MTELTHRHMAILHELQQDKWHKPADFARGCTTGEALTELTALVDLIGAGYVAEVPLLHYGPTVKLTRKGRALAIRDDVIDHTSAGREALAAERGQSLEEFCGEPHDDLAVGFSRAILRGEVPPPNWAEDAACRGAAEGLLCRVIRLWSYDERRAQLVSALAPFVSDRERLLSADEAIRFGTDECAELIVRAKPFAHLPERDRRGNYIHSPGKCVSVKLRWLLAEQFPELDRADLWREYLRGLRGGLS